MTKIFVFYFSFLLPILCLVLNLEVLDLTFSMLKDLFSTIIKTYENKNFHLRANNLRATLAYSLAVHLVNGSFGLMRLRLVLDMLRVYTIVNYNFSL